jgi:hypothetical protein
MAGSNEDFTRSFVGVIGTDRVEGEDPRGDWSMAKPKTHLELYPPSHDLEKQ